MISPLENVLARFPDAKPHGKEWQARCPAHADHRASLSIGPGDNGGCVIKCHAGCTSSAIVAAAGLSLADLMPPKPQTTPRARITSTYAYTDEHGATLYEVLRYDNKDFKQRRPDASARGGYTWSLGNVRRVLYHLPEVLEAVAGGVTVFVVEGEKDADNLRKLGFVATTNAGGAGKNKWLDVYTQTLRGASVVLIPDNDDTGRDHAREAATALHGVAASVKLIQIPGLGIDGPMPSGKPLPPKGDVSDWLKAGGTGADLQRLADAAPQWVDVLPVLPTVPSASRGTIPPPKGRDANGRAVYQPWQIVEILRNIDGYTWEVAAPDSHAAHAARLAQFLGDDLRYSPQLGWLFWNGKHWERDDKENTQAVGRAAGLSHHVKGEAAYLFGVAQTLTKDGRSEDAGAISKAANDLLKHAGKTENHQFLQGTLALAASRLAVGWEAFTPRPWVLGFDNGVWDRGTFRNHRRDDYMLSVSPAAYKPDADQSEWLAVLDRMTGSDAELARTLQQFAGYCLSGASHLRLIPWCYGPKGTGKSTFAELLKTTLGREAVAVDTEYLSGQMPRERLGALLWGKRFAMNAEAGEQRMNAEALKQLSGGDTLPVRFLFKEPFDAPPRHALLMVANDPPVLTAYDDALKSRVKVLPLTHSLSEPEPLILTGGVRIEAVRQDAQSPLVIGFVAWAVAGLAAVYQTQDVYLAPVVREATARFWQDTDPLTGFWESVSSDDLEKGITKADLRGRYEKWCEQEGVRRPLSPRQWAKACETQGLQDYKGTGGVRYWFRDKNPISGTSGTSGANSQKSLDKKEVPHGEVSENVPLVPLVPLTTDDLDTVTTEMVKAARVAADNCEMPDAGEVVPLLDGRRIDNPRSFLLGLVVAAAEVRKKFGKSWTTSGNGLAINNDVLAVALWWHRQGSGAPPVEE